MAGNIVLYYCLHSVSSGQTDLKEYPKLDNLYESEFITILGHSDVTPNIQLNNVK